MEKDLQEQELKNKIKEFCESKHFESPFVQECITEFIERHTELYGDIIPTEALFKRLEDNLDRITFAGIENSPDGSMGEYKGRIADDTDINEIFIYSNESDLELSETNKKMWNIYTESDKQKLSQELQQRRAQIKTTLLHELTHSAYTIKDKYGLGEKHIFSETSKDYLSGEYRQMGSNTYNVEAIVNYISSRVEGKSPNEISTYVAETKAIYMLAEKMDEKSIIQSAWISDEQQFKDSYIKSIETDIETGEKSYDSFQSIMKKLVIARNRNMSISQYNIENEKLLSELQKTFDVKNYELETTKSQDAESIKLENNISTNTPKEETNLSFSQKIAKFLEKHNQLMNIPFLEHFVEKQLKVLPPAKNQEENKSTLDLTNQRTEFTNMISSNGKLRELSPLQPLPHLSIDSIDKGKNLDETEQGRD